MEELIKDLIKTDLNENSVTNIEVANSFISSFVVITMHTRFREWIALATARMGGELMNTVVVNNNKTTV